MRTDIRRLSAQAHMRGAHVKGATAPGRSQKTAWMLRSLLDK